MIIDLILDRKNGKNYNSTDFYLNVLNYGDIGTKIIAALEDRKEKKVKNALIQYINKHDYNPAIIKYINSVSWL